MSNDTCECKTCLGEGVLNPCGLCENKGWVDDPSDGGTMCCPDCNGDLIQCEECEGMGWVTK